MSALSFDAAASPVPVTTELLSSTLGADSRLTTFLMKEKPSNADSLDACITHCTIRFFNLCVKPYKDAFFDYPHPRDNHEDTPPLSPYQQLVPFILEDFYENERDLNKWKALFSEDPSMINRRIPLLFRHCLNINKKPSTPSETLVGTTLLMLAFLCRKFKFAKFLLQQPNCDVHAITSSGLRAIDCLALERIIGHDLQLSSRGFAAWEANHSPEALGCLKILLEKNVDLLPVEAKPRPSVFHLFSLFDQAEHLELVLDYQKIKEGSLLQEIVSCNSLPIVVSSLITSYVLPSVLEMRCMGHFPECTLIPRLDPMKESASQELTLIEGHTPLLLTLISGATKTAKLLIDRGANVFVKAIYSERAKAALPVLAKDWAVDDFIENPERIPTRTFKIICMSERGSWTYQKLNGDLEKITLRKLLTDRRKALSLRASCNVCG